MKKNKFINKLFLALSMSVMVLACSDDDENGGGGPSVSFIGLATTVEENAPAADRTVTIPLRDGTVTEDDVVLTGTATLGTDYTFDGVTDEGLTFTILNDTNLEPNETIRITIPSSANNQHTLTIGSDCSDVGNLQASFFTGTWHATEQYGPGPGPPDWYGPYEVTFSQNATDPNRFDIANFYDAGRSAYIVFDLANGTVKFPDQQPLPDAPPATLLTASAGTFTVTACGTTSLTIDLHYDGGDWTYYFERDYPY